MENNTEPVVDEQLEKDVDECKRLFAEALEKTNLAMTMRLNYTASAVVPVISLTRPPKEEVKEPEKTES